MFIFFNCCLKIKAMEWCTGDVDSFLLYIDVPSMRISNVSSSPGFNIGMLGYQRKLSLFQ